MHFPSGTQFNEHSKTKSQPIKIEAGKGRGRGINAKNRECFSAPTDGYLDDFDFDTNLKLFNKAAVFEESDALSGGENEVPVKKFYGHDENILTVAENSAIFEGAQKVYKTGEILIWSYVMNWVQKMLHTEK